MKETRPRIGSNLPNTNELVRLQRANKDLVQLSNKLNSYTCEPCTYTLYEQIQSLRSRMEKLKSSNNEVITLVRQHKHSFEDFADIIKKQLRDFHELQKGVFDYTRMVRSLH